MSDQFTDGFWSVDDDSGTATNFRFAGSDGLARLDGPSRFSCTEPATFSAWLSRVQLDHVALEAFQATAHTAARPAASSGVDMPAVIVFTVLISGSARVQVEGVPLSLGAGDCLVTDSRMAVTYTSRGHTRILRALVSVHRIPEALLRHGVDLPNALSNTALVSSFIAFISSILASAASGRPASGAQLSRAVSELLAAVLFEAQESRLAQEGGAGLKRRIERFIEANYQDPELGPASVARAFSISVRHAHGIFNEGDRTLARFIRDCRLEAVAAEIRSTSALESASGLAWRHGFSSASTLTRAFLQRWGVSPQAFWRASHRLNGTPE